MNWFNYIGLIIITIIMIPNIIYIIKCPDGFNNVYKDKTVELFEQIGRYSSFFLMIFNIPYTYFNFFFDKGLLVYIIINSLLVLAYLISWTIYFKSKKIIRAYLLSIIPSIIFIFSGIMLLSLPLIVSSIVFAITHITISLKNAYGKEN